MLCLVVPLKEAEFFNFEKHKNQVKECFVRNNRTIIRLKTLSKVLFSTLRSDWFKNNFP